MITSQIRLAPEHREIAMKLWDALNSAPSANEANSVRIALAEAPPEVRFAIMMARVSQWEEGHEPVFGGNPFC